MTDKPITPEARHFEALDFVSQHANKSETLLIAIIDEIPNLLRTILALHEQCRQQWLMLAGISGALGASRNEDCEAAAFALQARVAELEQALVYSAHKQHGTPLHMLPKGLTLMSGIRGESVEVRVGERKVLAGPIDLVTLISATPPQAPTLTEDERAAVDFFALNPSRAVIAFDAMRKTTQAPATADGLVLVPKRMHMARSVIDALLFVIGGPDDEGEDKYADGIVWIGELPADGDTPAVYGVNVASSECPEEGSINLIEIDRPPTSAAPPQAPATADNGRLLNLIIRDVCELDPYDHTETDAICISTDDLSDVLDRYLRPDVATIATADNLTPVDPALLQDFIDQRKKDIADHVGESVIAPDNFEPVLSDADIATIRDRHATPSGNVMQFNFARAIERAAVLKDREGQSPYLPCPICKGVEGCDHTVPERRRAAEPLHDLLSDALHTALPFVEDAETDNGYKPDAVRRALKKIRAAIAAIGGG